MAVNNGRCSRCPVDNPEEPFLRLRFDWGCLCCRHLRVAHNRWRSSVGVLFRRSPEHVCRSEQEVRPESSHETTVGLPPRLSTPVFSPPPTACTSSLASFPTFLCLELRTNLAGVHFRTSVWLENGKRKARIQEDDEVDDRSRCSDATGIIYVAKNK